MLVSLFNAELRSFAPTAQNRVPKRTGSKPCKRSGTVVHTLNIQYLFFNIKRSPHPPPPPRPTQAVVVLGLVFYPWPKQTDTPSELVALDKGGKDMEAVQAAVEKVVKHMSRDNPSNYPG